MMRRVQRLPAVLVLLVALAGCDAPRSTYYTYGSNQVFCPKCDDGKAPPSADSPSPAFHESGVLYFSCLGQEIEPRASELWAAPAAEGKYPPLNFRREVSQGWSDPYLPLPEIVVSALEKCVPGYKRDPTRTASLQVERLADAIYTNVRNKYSQIANDVVSSRNDQKIAENQARLNQGEPAFIAKHRDCIFANATGMAVVSEEPAAVVASAAFAACRQQREAIVELHRRYGDAAFSDETMDKIEARVAPTIILMVIQARAAKRKEVPPTQIPPVPTTSPKPEDNSI